MSSLFVYHLQCPACGCSGPSLDLTRMPWDEILLPASNLSTGAFDAANTGATGRDAPDLAQLARAQTTETFRVAVVSLSDGILRVTPPLPCPRCRSVIDTAEWDGDLTA